MGKSLRLNWKDPAKALHQILNNYRVIESGCHEYLGRKDRYGYGQVTVPNKVFGGTDTGSRLAYTHALAHVYHTGSTGDKFVCHTCDNPSCMNPKHLFLGTDPENKDDMFSKGRNKIPVRKLSKEDVLEIFASSETREHLSVQFDVSQRHIQSIKNGKRHSKITGLASTYASGKPRTSARYSIDSLVSALKGKQ